VLVDSMEGDKAERIDDDWVPKPWQSFAIPS
jgi:hypothetical protein